MAHDHSCCAPKLTRERLFVAWADAKAALGPDANEAGTLALRLIAAGEKPTIDALGHRLGWARERLTAALAALDDAGLLTIESHEVTGAMGLTYLETPHALVLDGRPLYTWCALDAVGIPSALGANATIRSTTVNSGRELVLELKAGELVPPPTAVEVLVMLPAVETTFVEDECPQISFYDAGTAPKRGDAMPLTLTDAARLGRRIWSARP